MADCKATPLPSSAATTSSAKTTDLGRPLKGVVRFVSPPFSQVHYNLDPNLGEHKVG
jgi:hypothetical protein